MENLFLNIAESSPIAAVLAVALWQWIKLQGKLMNLIETNTQAMTRLADAVDQMKHVCERHINAVV